MKKYPDIEELFLIDLIRAVHSFLLQEFLSQLQLLVANKLIEHNMIIIYKIDLCCIGFDNFKIILKNIKRTLSSFAILCTSEENRIFSDNYTKKRSFQAV